MKQTLIQYLSKLWEFMEFHNRMAPFPPYDTEYVSVIKNKLEEMKKNSHIDYNKLPTVSCKYCDSIGIIQDEFDNDYCIKCGATNEINIFPTYYDYELYLINKKNDDY